MQLMHEKTAKAIELQKGLVQINQQSMLWSMSASFIKLPSKQRSDKRFAASGCFLAESKAFSPMPIPQFSSTSI